MSPRVHESPNPAQATCPTTMSQTKKDLTFRVIIGRLFSAARVEARIRLDQSPNRVEMESYVRDFTSVSGLWVSKKIECANYNNTFIGRGEGGEVALVPLVLQVKKNLLIIRL